MGSKKNKNGSPHPLNCNPLPVVFLLHGKELMGDAEKDPLLQQTVTLVLPVLKLF
jgi:hypothetical protein